MAKGKSNDKSSIEQLEEIGLREVSRKTYIELNYLKLMANREFSKLQRIKTLGFVKIIQREYGIKMDDWVKEFDEYFQENDDSKPKEKKIDNVLNPPKNVALNKKTYVVSAVLFLILFVIFAYSFTKGRTGHIENTLASSSIIYDESDINETGNDVLQPTNIQEEATDISTEIDTAQTATETVISNNTPKPNTIESFSATISPNTNIWVGIIDLATAKKRTYMQEEEIDLKLDKEQLVITGHGDFTLKMENRPDKKFNLQNRAYLYINGGTIEEISENDFMLLNGGRNW